MGQKRSDGEKLLLGLLLGIGALGLYYLMAGTGRENNAMLIPDALEGRIDRVVDTLNTRIGKNWVNLGVQALKSFLRTTLPAPLVELVDVVYAVEQQARHTPMTSQAKLQHAIAIATP